MNIENLILKLQELPPETIVKVWNPIADNIDEIGDLKYFETERILEFRSPEV